MSTTWERLAGDTSRFAFKIAFSDDPDGGMAATPEESASWGSFQLWANERNLCAHQFGDEILGSVHWYLLPLLEWWVQNWDPLFHEERLPNQNAAASSLASLDRTRDAPCAFAAEDALTWEHTWHAWWSRHCIEVSRSGGVFPSICFRRWRDKVEISWDGNRVAACPDSTRFVNSFGSFRLSAKDVACPLYSVLKEAASYLYSRCPDSERFASLCEDIGKLNTPSESRLAWLLGLGVALPEMLKSLDEVRQAASRLPATVRKSILGKGALSGLVVESFPAALMFGAVSPRLCTSDRVALIGHLAEARGETTTRVDELAAETPVEGEYPWQDGYKLAERLMECLGVQNATEEPVDVEAIMGSLGVSISEIALQDDSIRAIAIAGGAYRPTVLLNRTHRTLRYPTGRRFSLAHELCHILYDRAYAREVVIPSGPWAPRDVERRANAFAAMLLMPPERIRRVITSSDNDPASRALVVDVSTRLETSFTATVEHMRNLMLLSDEERHILLEDALDKSGRDAS